MSHDGVANAAGPVRSGYRFDEARLADWMARNVEGFAGPLTVEQFAGGQSNPTFKLSTPARHYVLRRKPPGRLLKGAHAVDREARMISALEMTDFPVPHVYALCTDDSVIGSWFYVMDLVAGRIFWEASFPGVPDVDRPLYFDSMNETLARLHRIDPNTIGLGDFGRPGNYFARQIARWSKQYVEDADAGRLADMDMLVEWLPANIPPGDEVSIVHGDYRVDNMIFHPTEPRVLAVLDWELSTLGHPLADFTYHLMMYRMPPQLSAGLLGLELKALGLPPEEEYVAAYCRRTGREGIQDLGFYMAYNMFRLAAIYHGIKGRAMRGTAASAAADQTAAKLPALAARAREEAELADGFRRSSFSAM
jgi:aminoglycoside phosphotransferase (APT) family kinase protein